jgi:hypothetical protein
VCEKAFFGWYCSETMEKMRRDFVAQGDPVKRKQQVEEIQKLAYDEVPYALWGGGVRDSGRDSQECARHAHVRGPTLWNLSIES